MSLRPIGLTGGLFGGFAGVSARIFAPMILPPQITSRDLVVMAGHYSGSCEGGQSR